MKNIRQTSKAKKKTGASASAKKPAAAKSRAKATTKSASPPDDKKIEKVESAVAVAAPGPSKAAAVTAPNAESGFDAGIFEVEERLYEPQAAPAVAVVDLLPEGEQSRTIVVEEYPSSNPSVTQLEDNSDLSDSDGERDTDSETTSGQEETGPIATSGDAEATAPKPVEEGREARSGRRPRRRRGSGRGRDAARAAESESPARDDDSSRSRQPATVKSEPAPQRESAPADDREEDDILLDGDDVAVDPSDSTRREMLINVSDPDEVRIALLNDGRLDELYIERAASISNVGNIYKGKVTNVEPSIQAAFVDFGRPAHGFLHISDLHPNYFPGNEGELELVGRKTPRRHRPPIQACLKRGQEVLVQVIKEGVGTKGPTLSTYISLPGRFLVMMPNMEQLGVSRKIEDEEQRRTLREALNQLSLPKDMGFIVRTAGIGRNKRDLQRDLNYLSRLWEKVQLRIKKEPAPATLYTESDLVIRTVRDVYDASLHKIIIDDETVAQRVREFLRIASPRTQDMVTLYAEAEPLFHRYGIETEIDKLYSKTVPLQCGGSLVIEQTEALVAIDVNSGRFRVPENAEETAFRVNLEAADEIARQLRLRDLGGLIICDFIDMLQERHRRQIEMKLTDALRKHKERAKLLRISRFGILEMTRQRQRPSFAKNMYHECPRCTGSGRVKAPDSVSLDVMRSIRLASQMEDVSSVDVVVATAVANDLLNRKRHQLTDIEREHGQLIRIHADSALAVDDVRISCTDRRGRDVPLAAIARNGTGSSREAANTGRPAATSKPASAVERQGQNRGRRGGRRRRGRGGSGASAPSGGSA